MIYALNLTNYILNFIKTILNDRMENKWSINRIQSMIRSEIICIWFSIYSSKLILSTSI